MELSFLSEGNKALLEKGEWLPIMEEFYTIQGEGFHSGKAAYFIRVGGCDVGCHWCDVKESWNPEIHPLKEVSSVIKNAQQYPAKAVVITGGEPLIYNMDYITQKLIKKGFQTHIETSGAYPLSGTWHWICLSPKKTMLPKEEVYQKANELKVIVYNQHDLVWAQEQATKVSKECKLYLQPEWSKRETVTPLIIDFVMQHPQWEISLQTHKYLNIP